MSRASVQSVQICVSAAQRRKYLFAVLTCTQVSPVIRITIGIIRLVNLIDKMETTDDKH